MRGRAAWPRLRRHLADKLGTPSLQGFLWVLGEVGSQFGLEGTPNFCFPDFPRGGRRRRIKFPQFFPRRFKFIRNPLPANDKLRTELLSLWPPVRPAQRCCAWPSAPAAQNCRIALKSGSALLGKTGLKSGEARYAET